jgi:hypothetical protein
MSEVENKFKTCGQNMVDQTQHVPELGIQLLPFGNKTYPDVQEHL